MDKKRFKKPSDETKFIPGIYNYCDRWCERCRFTARCKNYALSEGLRTNPESRDVQNETFWQNMNEIFRMTLEMVNEMAVREGIDQNPPDVKTAPAKGKLVKDATINHECSHAAKVYGKMVNTWFESAEAVFREKGSELRMKAQLKLPHADPSAEAASLIDAVEVIRWYQYQIYVKLMRALHGLLEENQKNSGNSLKDSDGSAKVALIAVDRSIAAWGKLREHLPEQGDDILDLLVHLGRIRKKAEQTFPNARAFTRPGFDEAQPHG